MTSRQQRLATVGSDAMERSHCLEPLHLDSGMMVQVWLSDDIARTAHLHSSPPKSGKKPEKNSQSLVEPRSLAIIMPSGTTSRLCAYRSPSKGVGLCIPSVWRRRMESVSCFFRSVHKAKQQPCRRVGLPTGYQKPVQPDHEPPFVP